MNIFITVLQKMSEEPVGTTAFILVLISFVRGKQ